MPFDIVVEHAERWTYFEKNLQMKMFSAQITKRYYCVQKICIEMRFPLRRDMLKVETAINSSHLVLLKAELGATLNAGE